MTKQKKLEKLFDEYFGTDKKEFNCEDIENFVNTANNGKILSYDLLFRIADCDSWYEARTGGYIGNKYVGITFNFEAIDTKYEYTDKEEIISDLLDLEKECLKVERAMKKLNKK